MPEIVVHSYKGRLQRKRPVQGNFKPRRPLPKAGKKKKQSITKLKKKLDQLFSRYIRNRDNHTCFTCGLVMEPTKSQNGHFVPRQYLALRWDEKNCHCQCYACNVLYNGQPSVYALKLVEKYGEGILEELESKRKELTKLTPEWYLQQIALYEEKISSGG